MTRNPDKPELCKPQPMDHWQEFHLNTGKKFSPQKIIPEVYSMIRKHDNSKNVAHIPQSLARWRMDGAHEIASKYGVYVHN